MSKIILDLCGGTGSWSRPYLEAGYDVRLVTLPGQDVRDYVPPKNVWGILAAPPCDHFALSGAQYWKKKDQDGRSYEALTVVEACLRIIQISKPVFWAMENPVGRLRYFIGPPVMYFHPFEYGDPWSKKTCLWGKFNIPVKRPVPLVNGSEGDYWLRARGGKTALVKMKRSVTPPGFARAFYFANQ